ncbi:hypothetical protein Tco_0970373 [Tanacetum coccineum]
MAGSVITDQDKAADEVGLILWGDLRVLIDSPEVVDGSEFWKSQHKWRIQSWKLYSFFGIHVLLGVLISGLVIYMFMDKKYPLTVKLMERMLDYQLEISHGAVGNELTTAVQLVKFLKKQIADSKRAGVHDCYHVISRWESITINRLNSQTWSVNKAKLAFVKNLLGESEKYMWQQWRTAYPGAYSTLQTIADDPQNITSQVRQLIIMEDPYKVSTDEKDRAYRDLDRLTCEETKNLWSFLNDFRQLAIKSRKLYFPLTTEKLFAKLPPSLSKTIEESFKAKHPGLSAGDCRSKQGNIARSIVYQELDLDDIWDIVSADFDDSSVYSISEGEGDVHQNISIMVQDTPLEEAAFMAIEGIDESNDEQSIEEDYYSHHAFMFHPGPPTKIADMEKDFNSNEIRLLKELLKEKTEQDQQMIKDQAKEYYENRAIIQRKEELWQSDKSLYVKDLTDALKIIDQLKTEQIMFEEQKDGEIRKLKHNYRRRKKRKQRPDTLVKNSRH